MRVLLRSEAARWSAVLESIANTTLVPKVEIDLRDRLQQYVWRYCKSTFRF